MDDFAGGEPLVGEIVGLRTFRVDETGLLLPLFSEGCWYDGVNTALCAANRNPRRRTHTVPDERCGCGFYVYGSPEAARQNRGTRHVQAVVSVWGNVLAGTKGVRAEHARIEALWLHPSAPPWLRQRVAVRYPNARLYGDADAMLAEHPLTPLSCYEPVQPRRWAPRVAAALGLAVALALGALPHGTLQAAAPLWYGWLAATAAVVGVVAWLAVGARFAGHAAAALLMSGLLAWMIAPLCGLSGWLLRLPVLRGLVVGLGGWLLATVRPRHFPIAAALSERTYFGARP